MYKIIRLKYVFIGGIVGLIAGAILGLLIGVEIGGNFFVDFEYVDVRGYEATGVLGAQIGALTGFIIGGLIGLFKKE
ncbi:hypothetical protein SAMN02745751_03618 [Dethiosulfatibacter aminovorans DSM 17477]|uniref:Uncharacterized protein n=1 Tax=Dethiosulfatibacter aminovorans DSM 17477 TaxID=1121476 RepID=A0A1M6MXE0_9FIRM|nr:hypothetical protein [Dethiosulfatibacter aminovorans]SHJ87993.1 hypothetical protein SAMN02745751_03618 [Dethiosulfatibacter aminovorans DSM 17477]